MIRTLRACVPAPLRDLIIINTRLRVLTLTNKHFTRLFVLYCVVSIARYRLTLKNPRKPMNRDFIPLKVNKFISSVDSVKTLGIELAN